MSHILSGDIGGTKTLLRLSTTDQFRAPLLQQSFSSNQYSGLAEIIEEFLQPAHAVKISSACFALAGPVLGRQVTLTNLPWSVDADALAAKFKIPRVSLINDFEAVGLAISALQQDDMLTLQAGQAQEGGTRLAVGAGTGLGVAWITWQNGAYQVHPSEGGHMDFAPSSAIEYELLCYLQKRHGHVSTERIVSGPGLVTIFEFLRDSKRAPVTSALLAAMRGADPAAALTQFAQMNIGSIAHIALDLFLSIYGAFVGNLALAALPRAGIYVAGGIAAKIAPQMQHGTFLKSLINKGRYTALLESLPIYIVTNPQVGLLGADLVANR